MDPRSEQKLATINPKVAAKVRAAAAILEEKGTYLLVVSGLRTAVQQNALYAQGRTMPGHIVTNARAGQSMHNYGLAADVVPYLTANGPDLNWNTDTPQYQAMVAALKAQGLAWGGDWAHFKDMDHFQMANLPANPTPAMQRAYAADSGLQSIWESAESGAFSA